MPTRTAVKRTTPSRRNGRATRTPISTDGSDADKTQKWVYPFSQGSAEMRDYITTLRATLDVTNLAPGAYQLAVRRHGEDWRLFPINVK